MTPHGHFIRPTWNPQKGPKAEETQTTTPPFIGNIVLISAVISASGIHEMNGKIIKPRRANSGPATFTIPSAPKGPPETS